VGHGDLFGEISDVFGLGGGAGCVCAIYVSQAGFRVRRLWVLMLASAHR
jgi:hypothetical protein